MMQRMRIAHVFPSDAWGGAEIYTVLLAETQMKAGLDVVLWGKPESTMLKEAQKRGIATLQEAVPHRLGLFQTRRLAQVLESEGITHLHCHWSGAPWAFWGIKRRMQINFIYHIHMWINVFKLDPFHAMAYRQIDSVVVAGERARHAALTKLPVRKEQVIICPYLLDPAKLSDLKTTRQSWGLPEGRLIFGLFSRIDPQKGVKEFALALESLLQNHPNVAGVVMGEPTRGEAVAVKYAGEVEKILAPYVTAGRVFRLPFRADYLEVLKNCDVLVAPSYNESYSLTFLDALALGVPVLSTDAGGTPDLISAHSGWLVEPRSVEALKQKLIEICNDPKEIKRRSVAGREAVRNDHLPEVIVSKFLQIYRRMPPAQLQLGDHPKCI